MDLFKIEKYLERIHYSGEVKADMDTLKKIHRLHPAHIPFENIDSYTGKVPSLELNDVFDKLVLQTRGGYCYEQNLLLNDILKYIGFNADIRLARVLWKKDEHAEAPRTHLLQTVEYQGEKYLVDCGFGIVTLTSPLLLNEEEPQQTPNGLFKITKNDKGYILWFLKESWLPVYRFALESAEHADLEIANWYLSTHPQSGFKNNLVLSKADSGARYTYSNHVLNIRYNNGEKKSVSIGDHAALYEMFESVFGLKENEAGILQKAADKE